MNQRPIINYDDTCNLIPFFFFLPLLSRISLRDHCGTFRCSEINCDSQFLNMALKAEWLTQLDLCDYGKSVRLYCLPGAILTTNPQLIEPNSAFCLTVRLFFPPSFQSQTNANNSPVKHHRFVKIQRSCPIQLCCQAHRERPDNPKWLYLLAFRCIPRIICFLISWLVNEERAARCVIIPLQFIHTE